MNAKLDSVLSALGGVQAEVNALKNKAPALAPSSSSPMLPLPLPISQFAGTQLLQPQTPLQPQLHPSPSGDSQVLEAMKIMAAMTYMHSVGSFFR